MAMELGNQPKKMEIFMLENIKMIKNQVSVDIHGLTVAYTKEIFHKMLSN
jgi:hypothetical protein